MTNQPVSPADALARYPELGSLLLMQQAGWVFRVAHDAEDELECVMASRSVQHYTDALFIHDRHTVTGARVIAGEGGGCVWMKMTLRGEPSGWRVATAISAHAGVGSRPIFQPHTPH